jgi:hypothetical protein
MSTKYPDLFAALAAPFEKSEVKALNVKGRQMHYITARTAMNRLDQVLGPENWWDEYLPGEDSVRCQLTIRLPDGATLTKYDAGGYAGMQDQGDDDKSGYSDAFKRACVKFGVGRYLYGDGVPRYRTNGTPAEVEPSDPTPTPTTPKPAPRDTWAAVVARIEQASKTWWENELTIEGIPREKWQALPNQWAITHHLAKHAVEKGVVLPDALEKPEKPGTKDRAKVLKVVSDLYSRAPRKIEAHVMAYLLREENRLRAELGMPERTDENSAQDGVDHASQETPGGREPGEEG